ncbi:MAG: hypothetical protein ACRD32_04190 [Nitrososphaerales archaeon]
MPKAVSNTGETVRRELETLPEGFVVLRKMTYGEMLRRRDLSLKVKAGAERDPEFSLSSLSVTVFEFEKCIVDHNLEDENGNKLNLSLERDVLRLDPQIAGEIETEIDKLNQPPTDDASKSLQSVGA